MTPQEFRQMLITLIIISFVAGVLTNSGLLG